MEYIEILGEQNVFYVVKKALQELDNKLLDSTEVLWNTKKTETLVSEPVVTSVVIAATTTAFIALLNLIKFKLESDRQKMAFEMVIKAYKISEEAGEACKNVAKNHSYVSLEYANGKLSEESGSINNLLQ